MGRDRQRCRGNLRPTPVFLSPETVGKVLALAFPPARKPEITRFDTAVKPGSNDNSTPHPRPAATGRRDEPARVAPQQAKASAPVLRNAQDERAQDRADSPLAIQEITTAESAGADRAGGSEKGRAPEGTIDAAAGEATTVENARQQHIFAAQHEPRGGAMQVEVRLHRGERPPADVIRAAAKALGVAIMAPRTIAPSERERLARAYQAKTLRQAQGERSGQAKAPLTAAPSREECPKCGIPGFKGCAHFLPCEAELIRPRPAPEAEQVSIITRKFTGKRRGIGASSL